MFKLTVNSACKQIVENVVMHETARRLYSAISELTNPKLTDLGDVAAYVRVTPQVLKNWESRGVSKQGRLDLHSQLGINPDWLATGEGEMLPRQLQSTSSTGGGLSVANTSPGPSLAKALEVVAGALNNLPMEERELAAQRLQTFGRAPDSVKALEALMHALEPEPKNQSVSLEDSLAGCVAEAALSVESRDIHPEKKRS